MKTMTGNEYQELAKRTMNGELPVYQQRLHALHGMSAEVGEIHSIHQKVYQGHTPDSSKIMDEVGDLLWFIAEYCTCMGFSLEGVMERNIEKLKKRYPEGFDIDRSVNREKYE